VRGGNVLVSPCLKCWGPFIVGRRLDNSELFISISTKGFTLLVGPNLRMSVCRGRLEASMVFRLVLESSRLPPTVPWALHDSGVDGARVSSYRGYLAKSLLGGDVFPRGTMRWMG
jgi:hypothetical protein